MSTIWVIRAGVVVTVLALLLLALGWGFQRQFIYHPDGKPVPSADTVIEGATDVELRTADGLVLGGWLVPPQQPARGLTVLVASGNAGDRSGRAPLARALAARGMQVLLFDYRGYGGNPGSPSESGLAHDVRAAREYLLEEVDVPAGRLLYYGESLGSGVVTELAVEHPPAGMLLRSPFTDLTALGRVHYGFLPVGMLLRDRFPLVDHLARVNVPVTVVYGSQDTIVPPEQSRRVAAITPRLRRLVEVSGAGHNDPALLEGAELLEAVVDLAEHVTGR